MHGTRLLSIAVALLVPSCMVGEDTPPHDHDGDEPLGPQPTSPVADSIAGGSVQALTGYTGIAGRALMVRRLDGKTDISFAATGLMPNVGYTAHLHAAPCRFAGGGHYKIDPLIADVVEANELWIKGMSSASGALVAEGSFAHLTRGEALSVVVHDPMGGAKMACADLLEDDVTTLELSGTLAPFAAAAAADMTVAGSIKMNRTASGTSFMLDLTGLDPAAVGYGTHIHAEPCGVATGGGHYKLDPTVVDTLETNELWLPITGYAAGTAKSMLNSPHVARTDAQSIVLHRTITDVNKPKVACANLSRKVSRLPLESSGGATALPGGFGMTLGGTAMMTRKLTGVTEVALVMTGLESGATYAAHVHNQACSAEAGGGHYKFDRAVGEARADNEIWFSITADSKGAGHDSTWVAKLASADAASLVVHGGDGMRLACFDLQ